MPPPPEAAGKKEWRGPQFDEYGTPVAGGTMYTGVGDKSAAPTGFFAQLGAMFGGGSAKKPPAEPQIDNVAAPRGVYMYGGVGCGKCVLRARGACQPKRVCSVRWASR
eukprot:3250874-Pleurochrysis_carterae.AAC.4